MPVFPPKAVFLLLEEKTGFGINLKPEELANFDAFLKNPELVWEWYRHRKQIVEECSPNAGHTAIADAQKVFQEVTVVTQNIDNLHRRAGSKTIYELHGNIERNYCIKCRKKYNEQLDFSKGVPKCDCGGLIRPDVVWFGEYLPSDQFNASEKAAMKSDIFFVVGTSAVVFPAASIIYTAKSSGSFIVEINIEETGASSIANQSYFGESGKILPELLEKMKEIIN